MAKERKYRLAKAGDIYDSNNQHKRHNKLVNGRSFYPTFEGHRLLARSVLDVFGYAHLEVPKKLRFTQAPGLIKKWQINDSVPREEPLTGKMVKSDEYKNWPYLHLPQKPHDEISRRLIIPHQSYTVQARSIGIAMSITNSWQHKSRAVAEYISENEETVYLNLGGDMREIWLNGEVVKKDMAGIYSVGRHAGLYRVPVKMKKGLNKIYIEAYNSFFVSVTKEKDWGLQKPHR